MKALVYTGVRTLAYQEVPEPVAVAGESRVRVERVGICGSDMHAFQGHDERRPAPLILGHEAAGTVIGGERNGQRVTVNPLVGCGTCPACTAGRANLCASRQILSLPPRQGAFADQVMIPHENLVSVPDGVSFDKASLAEPIACGWHAVRLGQRVLNEPLASTRCLVIGGGAIGVGAALSLLANGATDVVLVEPNEARRRYLDTLGELDVRAPEQAGSRFGLVIDGVGYPATRAQSTRVVDPGGVVLHIGLGSAEDGLDIRRMTLQEITFIGTYTYTPDDFRATAAAIFDGSLGSLAWTETRALKEGGAAFDDIRNGCNAAPKLILVP